MGCAAYLHRDWSCTSLHQPADDADERVVAWIPADIRPDLTESRMGARERINPGEPGPPAVARVRAGVTPEGLAQELTGLVRQLPDRFGNNPAYARLLPRLQVVTRPLRNEIVGPASRPLGVLFAATLIVLVIACANVSNLFAVRSESRRHELGVRQAIGAQRGQLIRAQISEVIVVALAAAILAAVLARVALPIFVSLAPGNVPRLSSATIDVPTIAFTFLLALAAGLACGLAPALRSSRARALDLRGTARSVTSRHRWERDALLVGQAALAIVLLASAGLLMRSYTRLSRVDPGYATDNLFTFQFAPSQPRLSDGPSWARFHLDFMERLRTLPGVQSVGVVDNVPLDEGAYPARFFVDGASADAARPETVRRMVVRQGAQIVGAGVALGTVVALVVTPALGRLLFGVAPIDPATFAAVVATMALVGLLASYIPAWRASNVDPIISLRGE